MNLDYIIPNEWSIIEEGFHQNTVKTSKAFLALGMVPWDNELILKKVIQGQHFEVTSLGLLPDKTRVGWWKNGYPEYFAKVLNAPSWIGIHVRVNGKN